MLECDLSDDGVFNGFAKAIDHFVGGDGEMVQMRMLVIETLKDVVPGNGVEMDGVALPGGSFNAKQKFFEAIVFGVLGESFGD